jgi:hypothetical protein
MKGAPTITIKCVRWLVSLLAAACVLNLVVFTLLQYRTPLNESASELHHISINELKSSSNNLIQTKYVAIHDTEISNDYASEEGIVIQRKTPIEKQGSAPTTVCFLIQATPADILANPDRDSLYLNYGLFETIQCKHISEGCFLYKLTCLTYLFSTIALLRQGHYDWKADVWLVDSTSDEHDNALFELVDMFDDPRLSHCPLQARAQQGQSTCSTAACTEKERTRLGVEDGGGGGEGEGEGRGRSLRELVARASAALRRVTHSSAAAAGGGAGGGGCRYVTLASAGTVYGSDVVERIAEETSSAARSVSTAAVVSEAAPDILFLPTDSVDHLEQGRSTAVGVYMRCMLSLTLYVFCE